MSKATAVELPLINVNDESVKLVAWLVKDGDEVREGQNLAEIETSKALVELAAPGSGTVHLRVAAGEDLAVGTIVAYIGAEAPAVEPRPPLAFAAVATSDAPRSPDVSLPGTRFSKKALALIECNGLAPETFAGIAMVREQHVQDYLARGPVGSASAGPLHFALKGISLEGVSLPGLAAETSRGMLDPAFLDSLRKDPEAIAALSPADKCKVYRKHGAEIGEDVVIGKRTILIAPQIQLGDGVRVGENSSVIVRERVAISALSSFREGLVIRGGTVVFGQNTFAGSRIQIGGGGNADPWAVFVAGDNVYLGDDLFINICRPVVIGKEVFLTQRTILVTHNIGHSILEGHENTFAPIVLEDFAQVGMNATLYAGSRVGEGSVLASNSYLISAIPKGKLAIGVPAHVVRDAARPVTRHKQLQIAETMLRQFHELLQLKHVQVEPVQTSPLLNFTAVHNGKMYQLGFLESLPTHLPPLENADETVLWTFDSAPASLSAGITVMNVLKQTLHGPSGLFADAAREFLRKRGIRLEPGPWRYHAGLI
ncbi:MAG: biotin/lipoyl-binding protein [Acidobacteriia bacterium]|nr:biotin/lipoyl-binding protein [Terriglobia bacterium]